MQKIKKKGGVVDFKISIIAIVYMISFHNEVSILIRKAGAEE